METTALLRGTAGARQHPPARAEGPARAVAAGGCRCFAERVLCPLGCAAEAGEAPRAGSPRTVPRATSTAGPDARQLSCGTALLAPRQLPCSAVSGTGLKAREAFAKRRDNNSKRQEGRSERWEPGGCGGSSAAAANGGGTERPRSPAAAWPPASLLSASSRPRQEQAAEARPAASPARAVKRSVLPQSPHDLCSKGKA